MQFGDNEPVTGQSPEERDAILNERYREEGWGLITDKVWEGRVAPIDVESRARDVARWAYEQVKSDTARINDLGNQLTQNEQELKEAAHYAHQLARIQPQLHGIKAALRLKEIALKRSRLEWAQELNNRASVEMRLAECELFLAEHAAHVGGKIPTTLNRRSLDEWLGEPDEVLGGCCAES